MCTKRVWASNGWEQVMEHYSRPLKYMPYAQAGIDIGVNSHNNAKCEYLISYTTLVAWIDEEGNYGCLGLYSATTRRHIGAFAREHGLTYQDFKDAYEKGYEGNRNTGVKTFYVG